MTRGESLDYWWKNSEVTTRKLITPGTEVELVPLNPRRIFVSWHSGGGLPNCDFTPVTNTPNVPLRWNDSKAQEVEFVYRVDRDFILAQCQWLVNDNGAMATFWITEVVYTGG